MSLPIDPVRLCCGQRHITTQCPDGLIMCCLCFSRFPLTGLHKGDDGYEDVCLQCAANEIIVMARITYPTFDDNPVLWGLSLGEPMTEAEAKAASDAEAFD